jgi:hypothetical protein
MRCTAYIYGAALICWPLGISRCYIQLALGKNGREIIGGFKIIMFKAY